MPTAAVLPTQTSGPSLLGVDYSVGTSIPPATPHAVSVSLPRWQDNVDYEEGRLTDIMEIGYPRFFIHKDIQKLASVCVRKFGQPSVICQTDKGPQAEAESCLLVPSQRVAESCREFMQDQYAKIHSVTPPLSVRIVHFSSMAPVSQQPSFHERREGSSRDSLVHQLSIYIVLFPASTFPLAKSFWQHSGDGISSRMAETALGLLEQTGKLHEEEGSSSSSSNGAPRTRNKSAESNGDEAVTATLPASRSYSRNRHYARAKTNGSSASIPNTPTGPVVSASSSSSISSLLKGPTESETDKLCSDHATYVEERYGRNMPRSEAPKAKLALRRRIAGIASDDAQHMERAAAQLNEDDVYLYPTGMSSIFHAHQAAMAWRWKKKAEAVGKSVCFGFPYTDTLKILQKWGPGCWFFGNGTDEEMDQFESLLKSSSNILALFCEFPSNPLLRSPNLARLRGLADRYSFLLIVDETIGNFVNVEVLPYADIVVSSMTKIFSGAANSMGGSMVLNPSGKHYEELQEILKEEYEDNYYDTDAVFMERNSRDFVDRVGKIDHNAETLVDVLWSSKTDAKYSTVVKDVYYPKYVAREHYDQCRRKDNASGAGFGGLFSITFHTMQASATFYDALRCAKGPSLGTNFTLASPYCILAHYAELDWAATFGVESNLIRVSVGLEDTDALVKIFQEALDEAVKVCSS